MVTANMAMAIMARPTTMATDTVITTADTATTIGKNSITVSTATVDMIIHATADITATTTTTIGHIPATVTTATIEASD